VTAVALPRTPPPVMDNDAPRIVGLSPEGPDDRGRGNPSGIPDALLAAFAHEMRNALGPVRTAAYLLRASARDDVQAQWALDLIDRQVRSITTSIDELADVARLKRGTLELGSEAIDLGEVVDSAASACAGALAERRQTLEWTRAADRIAVRGDRARLLQALSVVMRTTSRVAAAGTRIAVQMEEAAAEVTLAIGETPEGEPTQSHATADSAAGQDASVAHAGGVGLALAHGILALHGGSLTATGGARFEIRLPLAAG
jgi:signal transduction histidine kinase